MPRTAVRPAPIALPDTTPSLPTDLFALRGAPARLRVAEASLDRADAALREARHAHANLSQRLSAARWEESEARAAFKREQAMPRHVEAGVSITTIGGGENPAAIGPRAGSTQGVMGWTPPDGIDVPRWRC